MSEVKFNAIRARVAAARERRTAYETDMLRKYGQCRPPQAWLTRGECTRDDAIDRAQTKAWNAMFDLLDVISPRQWRTGVAAWWVAEELSYADAITSGALSVLPRAGFGTTQREVERFAAAA